MAQDQGGEIYPHQSFTYQANTIQGSILFLLHFYFPQIDPNIFIAWGMVSSCVFGHLANEKIVWYGRKHE